MALEHVELKLMLVKAEASMKAEYTFNNAMVDYFLDFNVQNVLSWEMDCLSV